MFKMPATQIIMEFRRNGTVEVYCNKADGCGYFETICFSIFCI